MGSPPSSSRQRADWRHWVRTHLAWVGWVSVGAALVVGGVILGASLTSSGTGPPIGPPVPPQTVCGTSQPVSGPGLCMVKQSEGPADTAFAVQGTGFAPGAPVTFMLSEIGPPPGQRDLLDITSSYHAVAEPDGTFQVAVSQLYSSPLALGLVTVTASGPGGAHASTEFMITPNGPPPAG